MNFGILIKGTNAIFRSNWPIFICEVVAGLVILNGLFGWMDLLIFVKWMKPLDLFDYKRIGRAYCATDITGQAPMLISKTAEPMVPSNFVGINDSACKDKFSYFYTGPEISNLCPCWDGVKSATIRSCTT